MNKRTTDLVHVMYALNDYEVPKIAFLGFTCPLKLVVHVGCVVSWPDRKLSKPCGIHPVLHGSQQIYSTNEHGY